MKELVYYQGIDYQMAYQCAGVLSGIKVSNLLMLNQQQKEKVPYILEHSEVSVVNLSESEKRCAFFLYKKEVLDELLETTLVKRFLFAFGYECMERQFIFEELSWRYEKFLKGQSGFPHEIGILLGYPLEDVIGFIHNDGREYLYAGYWKVYVELTQALTMFEKYDEARMRICGMVLQGMPLKKIITKEPV